MATEDDLLATARTAGVPVPATVVDVATATPRMGEARISERRPGEALGPRLVRARRDDAGRRALAQQWGQALARIHALDPAPFDGLDVVEDPLALVREGLDLVGETRPAFELALRHLDAHRPPAQPEAVVHGDFRVGNLLVDGDELTAVLDWELAHRGDPLEDLGWLCVRAWRFGGGHEVGGIAALDDLLAAYAEASGTTVDAAHVRWWTAVGTLRWGLICAVQARRHLDGHVRSVELATIGRRVSENEHDALTLLGVDLPPAIAPAADANESPHGRPTAAELVEAVRGHLADVVAPALAGSAAFHTRVADRALAIVERELRLGPGVEAAHRRRLDALGFGDDAALAAAIRAGQLDGRTDVGAAVAADVVDRLRVDNPSWLHPDASSVVDPAGAQGAGGAPAAQPAKDQVSPSR